MSRNLETEWEGKRKKEERRGKKEERAQGKEGKKNVRFSPYEVDVRMKMEGREKKMNDE
jgi:hypothetical protein